MHTRYKDGLENVVFTVKAEGKRRIGRLRLFYIGNLSKCVDFGEAELLLATKFCGEPCSPRSGSDEIHSFEPCTIDCCLS